MDDFSPMTYQIPSLVLADLPTYFRLTTYDLRLVAFRQSSDWVISFRSVFLADVDA